MLWRWANEPERVFRRAQLGNIIMEIDDWIDRFVSESVFRCRVLSLSMAATCCEDLSEGNALPTIKRRVEERCGSRCGQSDGLDTQPSYQDLDFLTPRVGEQVRGILKEIDALVFEEGSSDAEIPDGMTSLFIDAERERLQELVKLRRMWDLEKDAQAFTPEATMKFKMPRSAQHPLDDLLIYRTILYAVLLELATDVSKIRESDDCNRIIPML